MAPYVPPEALEELDLAIGAKGADRAELLSMLDEVLRITPRSGSKRFANQLFSGREPTGTMVEILTVLLNNSMYTYKAAGVQVAIERLMARHMAERVGYPDGEGVFTPGGSMSNYCAVLIALGRKLPSYRDSGLDGRRYTLYTSEQSHYSIPKCAAMAGVGRENVRAVECDTEGRMLPDALRRHMERDAADGCIPFMVNATSGTTVLGAFDPLRELAPIAHEHGAWFHVDGAFGGTALLSDDLSVRCDGSELSDSFTWDAHKMMGMPLTCSVILTKEQNLLREAFDQDASYLYQETEEESLNHGRMSLQCGRRNDSLKLWAAWKRLGDRGYAERVEHQRGLALHAASIIRDDPAMILSKEPQWVNVCFEVTGKGSREICNRLRREQRLLVGYAEVDGRWVIRIPFINADLTERDVEEMIDEIRDAGAALPEASNEVAPQGVTC